jgi:hypothetical protein
VTKASQITPACTPLLTLRLLSRDLEYPTDYPPSEVLVGSNSPEFPQHLSPPEVSAFVDGAGQTPYKGLVAVSFGSTKVYSGILGKADYMQMVAAWSELNRMGYRVLWVLRDQGLPEGLQLSDLAVGPDTMILSWMQQNNLLGHPNTK